MRKSDFRGGEAAQAAALIKSGGGGFGPLQGLKPFRVPTLISRRGDNSIPARKRKKVVYGDDGVTEEKKKKPKKDRFGRPIVEESDDEDGPDRKRKKQIKDPFDLEEQREWPVFKPKMPGLQALVRPFAIPEMRDRKTGSIIQIRLTQGALGVCRRIEQIPRPLHDPLADHAIVLYDPTIDDSDAVRAAEAEAEAARRAVEEQKNRGPHKSLRALLGLDIVPKKVEKVPVVIDPRLSKVLRPHQIEGVKFLYKAATGAIADDAFGCIMADEMGLGKTLQCISLLFTLLKQSPQPNKTAIDKAIVACPASLVKNWANELVKWLGPGAVNPFAIDGSMPKSELIAAVRQWCALTGKQVAQPVIIVSYESLRSLTDQLGDTKVGLLLCDEAHRLKNAENQTYTALNGINVKRRVLLTGTPVQNDLTEYFSLLNFALPNYLGSRQEFRKNYELAIIKGRDADATEIQRERCQEKLRELSALVHKFVIRRTNTLLTKYLPIKYEHVVFCALSPFQQSLYNVFIKSPDVRATISESGANPLVAIGMFQKLCNHPDLLDLTRIPGAQDLFPPGYDPTDRRRELMPEFSGKMLVLERFLDKMRRETTDKIVLISNYTETLDVFEKLLRAKRYGYFRLEGSTTIKKRQKLVDQFNDPNNTNNFVFLLSSKAGGCGINLIGANRLILFDPDWNPASDQQALARVWRDGQKKACFVYRFIATGTVEEKIFQRQAHKQALSSAVVDQNEAAERHFSIGDLKQLFKYIEGTISETHDTFKCKRCRDGKQFQKAPAMLYGDTSTWNHFSNECLNNIHCDLLRSETGLGAITSVFQYISS